MFFNGYLLHGSFPNRSPPTQSMGRFRRSLLFVYASAETPMAWHPTDVTKASALSDYRDIVMVAGADPYAWKGTPDIGRAYVRKPGPTVDDQRRAAIGDAALR